MRIYHIIYYNRYYIYRIYNVYLLYTIQQRVTCIIMYIDHSCAHIFDSSLNVLCRSRTKYYDIHIGVVTLGWVGKYIHIICKTYYTYIL